MKIPAGALITTALLLAGCSQGTLRAEMISDQQPAQPAGSVAGTLDSAPEASATASVTATTTATVTATPEASASGTSSPPSGGGSASPSAGAVAAGIPADLQDFFSEEPGGGPANVVRVENQTDNRVRSEGRLQGKTIKGDVVQPVNQAFAFGSCTNCQTYAVALQIVVYRAGAHIVAPKNEAIALNFHCNGCNTVARAVQYVIPSADPDKLPDNVQRLARQVKRDIGSIQSTPGITPAEADARINALIGQFQDLVQNLSDKRDETHDTDSPNASPPANSSPTASVAPSASSGTSPSQSASGSPAGSSSAVGSAAASVKPTAVATATVTATPGP